MSRTDLSNWTTEEKYQRYLDRLKASQKKRLQDPVKRAQQQQRCRQYQSRPEIKAARQIRNLQKTNEVFKSKNEIIQTRLSKHLYSHVIIEIEIKSLLKLLRNLNINQQKHLYLFVKSRKIKLINRMINFEKLDRPTRLLIREFIENMLENYRLYV